MSSESAAIEPKNAFESDARSVMNRLRSALMEVIAEVDADPTAPQELSRRLHIDKSLAWKLSRIVQADDPLVAIPHVPGAAGLRIFEQAVRRAGVAGETLGALSAAQGAFDRLVEHHSTDRATLELLLTNLAPDRDPRQIESIRKRTFKGNSGLWGVQAKLHLATSIIAPSSTAPGRMDLVRVGGFVQFRRLRSSQRWLFFRRFALQDDGSPIPNPWEPLDTDLEGNENLALLGAFCSNPLPAVEPVTVGRQTLYELPEGPVGNTSLMDCIYGAIMRGFDPIYRDEHNSTTGAITNFLTPVEVAHFDVIVHESLETLRNGTLELYNLLGGDTSDLSWLRDGNKLPLVDPFLDLGRDAVAAASIPQYPQYRQLMRFVFDRAGWDPAQFYVRRFSMTYPPIPTAAVFRAPLPAKPTDEADQVVPSRA